MHRERFQADIETKETKTLQRIFFSPAEFEKITWIDKNKEFEYGRNLYDVSRIEKNKNGFIIHCENDNWEEEFISLFSTWKCNKTQDGKIKFIFQPMFLAEKISLAFTGFVIDIPFSDSQPVCPPSHSHGFYTPPRS